MVFYQMFFDFGKRKRFAYAIPLEGFPTEEKHCEVCGRTWNSFKKLYEDTSITYPIAFTNNYFPDLMNGQSIDLISSAAKDFLLEQNIKNLTMAKMPIVGISELSKEKIKKLRDAGYVIKKLHDEKPDYYRFNVAVGASLHADSNVVWVDSGKGVCTHCGLGVGYKQLDYFAPLFLKLDTWNGTDLFAIKELGGFYCTAEFKKCWEEAKLVGACFDEIIAK